MQKASPASLFKLIPKETPLVILSEGCFGEHSSKTATGVIRYGEWPIVAVIDSTHTGKTVQEVTGIPCPAPIVRDLKESLGLQPKALLIGTAPQGGGLPETWRDILYEAVSSGLHIISGLHIFLKEDPKLVQLARESHVMLWDVRDCDQKNIVAQKKKRPTSTKVITIVGTDCSVGKMCTALELHQGAQKQGRKSAFVATGQTGILISGSGVPLDRVIGDFMAGHVERCLFEAIKQENPEWIFVEGQGSLLHPGYSSVTLSLIHGSDPDALILCHNPELSTLWGYEVPIPPLSKVIEFYEQAASWPNGLERKAKVVGIALNTSGFSEENAQQIIQAIGIETGLPVTDPVRYSVNPLLEALSRS